LYGENHKLIDGWIKEEPLITWVPPRAGSVGFMKHSLNITAEEICKQLIKGKSTFMVPGDCFEMSQYLRIGYGNNIKVLREGLARFKLMEKSFRHRLTETEVSLIVEGLLMKLKALYEKRDDSDMVKLTYVFLKKMMY